MSSNKIRDQTKKNIGLDCEQLACEYLQEQGLQIVERNRHISRVGEIDIVALEENQFVFVEVRSISSSYIHPSQLLSAKKQHRLIVLAKLWLKLAGAREYEDRWRIDLIALNPEINWYKGIL